MPLGAASGDGEPRRRGPGDRWQGAGIGERRRAPGTRICEQCDEQLPRMRVARPRAAEVADDWSASEVEIAERVEQLVADELVGEAQPAVIEHPVAADHDRVVKRAA